MGRPVSRPPQDPGDPVVIWGAGAMGGSIGAWLHRAGREVLLVDRDAAHVEAIRRDGLRITGPVDAFTQRVPAVTPDDLAGRGVRVAGEATATGGTASAGGAVATGGAAATEDATAAGGLAPPFRAVLLAVKAHHTDEAVRQLAPHLAADGYVVSVQNGLNERAIADVIGQERTVGCFVNFGADVTEPGVVMRGNRGAVVVGELDGKETPRIRAVHELFRLFEPDAVLTDDIHGYLWGKLAYGAILFATALTDASIADVLDSARHRPVLAALAREVTAVARALGVRSRGFDGFDPTPFVEPGRDAPPPPRAETADAPATGEVDPTTAATFDALVRFNRASAKSHSGVWRDLAVRKRRTEVDAQIAPIADLGSEAGVATPLVRRLVELIHDVEQGRREQSWETLDALAPDRLG